MKLIVFATYEEAKHSLKRLEAQKFQDHFIYSEGKILITGIGPFAAYTCLERHIDGADTIYNIGIAGSLHETSKTCYEIRLCSKYRWHPKNPEFEDAICFEKTGVRLCTLDFPLHDQKTKELLGQHFDLVDMEGYAISLLAKKHNKVCHLIKAVSDFCDSDTPKRIQHKIDGLSQELAQELASYTTPSSFPALDKFVQ